mmetsp:Transcript_39648/g.55055  ORF Transcript_39648/g.55055 Transcript_39648/m.55055 type:complete len:82 (-) Transcript_39648:71-316(-)|eukprot:CAMPEP_0196595528 /NCGR_PEP_ID=MMETSP1081-20130531/81337_1 /TAXON_ID=36882 /ORGANISM="Pyramimonas amylifera, Strain CCMP720" /LENGTH=81 /DNA_ID=CAMNT_0041920135 /DNA_START=184 /DNA_END=429 /DNA_ORIENTATION=-
MAKKSDEEIARELQAQFDSEIPGASNSQDEEIAKSIQEELELEDAFAEANRQVDSQKDEKAAIKAQQEQDYLNSKKLDIRP